MSERQIDYIGLNFPNFFTVTLMAFVGLAIVASITATVKTVRNQRVVSE